MKRSELKQIIKEEIHNVLKENKFIRDFEEFIGDKDATSVDIDYFSAQNKLTPEQKSVLKNKFLPNISIKSTGPLSPDINPRFGK
jgi:ribosomal protein S8